MTEDERRGLYMTLLRGITNEAQDQLCAADEGHDWGPWHQFQIRHDEVPLRFTPGAAVANQIVRTCAERKCLNCGKEQTA
jgi:hypothetical protein